MYSNFIALHLFRKGLSEYINKLMSDWNCHWYYCYNSYYNYSTIKVSLVKVLLCTTELLGDCHSYYVIHSGINWWPDAFQDN